jgi:hypothetical protein
MSRWARFECVGDGASELSFEAADRFAAAFAFAAFAFEVCACGRVVAGLRDRDLSRTGFDGDRVSWVTQSPQ